MANAVTLAARRAKADISRGGTSLLRGRYLVLRKQGTTTYRIVENTVATYSAGGTSVATTHRARTSNVVTLTTAVHGLAVGDVVMISGLSGTGYNVVATVASVPSTTTFTYVNYEEDEAETPDTGGAVTTCPRIVWSGSYTATATETYDRIYLCGSIGANAINSVSQLQDVLDADVSAPVLDPTDDDSCTLAYSDVTPTEFASGQIANPTLTVNEPSN